MSTATLELAKTATVPFETRKACRVCRSSLATLHAFGKMPLANGFDTPDVRAPLTLAQCIGCKLIQLREVVDRDTLFGNYAYRAGSGGMQQEMFKELAESANRVLSLGRHDVVIDIGANDGSLLWEFGRFVKTLVGIDPHLVDCGLRSQFPITRYSTFWSLDTAKLVVNERGQAKLITATNTWAHIDDLHGAAAGIATALATDGYFIIQVPWVRDLLVNNLYDTIYHEHLSYFSIKSLRRLFQKHWMDVHHVDYLPNVHGGTIRVWVGHGNDYVDRSVAYFEHMEKLVSSAGFSRQVQMHRRMLSTALAPFEHVWMYGASAKGVMLMNMASLDAIEWVLDDTPTKQNREVPGMTVGVDKLRPCESWPDVILITAWNYAARIRSKLHDAGYRGKVCIPMPIPRIEDC